MAKGKRAGSGVCCENCGEVSERFEHGAEFVPPTNKGYFKYWYICQNKSCSRTVFFPPKESGAFVPAPAIIFSRASDDILASDSADHLKRKEEIFAFLNAAVSSFLRATRESGDAEHIAKVEDTARRARKFLDGMET